MPSIIPILNIAPLFALYNDSSTTPSADSAITHPTVSSISSHSSAALPETSNIPSPTTISESPTPSLDFAPASPGTSLPISSSSFTPTHVPFHARPFDHLNIWAYLALAFLMLALTTIVAYCTYACYHSAKKDTSRNGKNPNGCDNGADPGTGNDEERGEKVEFGAGSLEAGHGRGAVMDSCAPHTSESSLFPLKTQSYNMHQPTHQLHYGTSKDTEWHSATEDLSIDSMVENNLKRFSEAEATCNFVSGIKSTSEHPSKSGPMTESSGGGSRKPLKSSLKPSFLRTKTDKLQKRGSLKGSKKGVSFSAFRSGMGSINAGFKSVRRSGMRGLGIGMSRGHGSDDSYACTEMIQLRTYHKHKHTNRYGNSPQTSMTTSLSNPTCASSSLEGAGSITQSSSSAGASSSTHDRSYAFVGSSSTNESSDDTHNLNIHLLQNNPSFNSNRRTAISNHTNVDSGSHTSTASPVGPFAATNSTYLPFHLRPPPPSPTPAHKHNVERQYAAYRRSKGFKLKSKGKEGGGSVSKGHDTGAGGGVERENIGAELELTHSPVSPSPSPSPSFMKPIGMSIKEGPKLGLGLGKKNVGKALPSLPSHSSTGTNIVAESSIPSSPNVGVTYDAHNIRFAQPPQLPSTANGPNTPPISQSPQMAMLWKEPKLSPISGEIISTFSGFSNSASNTAGRGMGTTIPSAPLALPISSPILSPVLSPSPSPTSATAASTSGSEAGTAAQVTVGQPTTPSKAKNGGRFQGLGLFKGNTPSRSPSPNKSPRKRNGLLTGGGGGGGFSLTPTMPGPPRLPTGAAAGKSIGSNGGNGGGGSVNNTGGVITPEAARARMQTLKKLTTGG